MLASTIVLNMDRTMLGCGEANKYGDPPGQFHSPLLSRCHGEGLLAIEVVVPCGGTGGGGSCKRSSECEVEGGVGGLGAGGGGRGTLLRISNRTRL